MISAPQPEGEGVRDHKVLGTKPIVQEALNHTGTAQPAMERLLGT
jgi:hypothetical protein